MMKVAVPQRFKLRVVPDVKTLIFGSGREVHYIGGTEVLPPPLEGMRESEMINRLGTEYAEDAKKCINRTQSPACCIHCEKILTIQA